MCMLPNLPEMFRNEVERFGRMDVLQHGIPDKTRPWFEPKDGIWAPDIKIIWTVNMCCIM